MEIPETLLKKYNAAVPRYTSYPPANLFRDNFTGNDLVNLISDSNNRKPENIALYVHIPFCKKICYYCGCNSCATGSGIQVKPYMEALKTEFRLVAGLIDKNRPVSQIHYGGGTPNAIDISFLHDLNNLFFSEFKFIENPEVAIECNPEFLTFKNIDSLLEAGFNRFSLGIQDFNNEILKNVNRTPSKIYPGELFSYLKNKNNAISVNFDFIYGLPGQTVESFTETMEKAINIRPDRLVTFSYAHVPWLKKHQLILEKKGLPASGEKMKMFLAAYKMLKKAGYEPLGLDHFVLPEDDLFNAYLDNQLHRNFQGYCTRRTTGQVYAFGVTAISQLENGYSQNTRDIDEYIDSVKKGILPVERGYIVSENEKITRDVINKLMCNKKLNFSEVASDNHINVQKLKETLNFKDDRLESFIEDGLLKFNGNEIEVSETGTMFIRNIAVLFDREYHEMSQTYSRTV